jgi:hypothetical protein
MKPNKCKSCKRDLYWTYGTATRYRFCRATPKCSKLATAEIKKRYKLWELEGWTEISCDRCGQDFVTTGGFNSSGGVMKTRRRFCSDQCRKSSSNERNNSKREHVEHDEIGCSHCGEKFQPVRSTAKFCSPKCRVAANRAKNAKIKSTAKRRVKSR